MAKKSAKAAARKALRLSRFKTCDARRNLTLVAARRLTANENERSMVDFVTHGKAQLDVLWNDVQHLLSDDTGVTEMIKKDVDFQSNWAAYFKGAGIQMMMWNSWQKLECRNNSAVECKVNILPYFYTKKHYSEASAAATFSRAGAKLYGTVGQYNTEIAKPWVPIGPTVRQAKKDGMLKWGLVQTYLVKPGFGFTHFLKLGPRKIDLDAYMHETDAGFDNNSHYPNVTFGCLFWLEGCVANATADDVAGFTRAGYMDCMINVIQSKGCKYQISSGRQTKLHEVADTSVVTTGLEVRQAANPENLEQDPDT